MSDDYSVELPAGYDCEWTTPSAGDCFTLRLSVSTRAEWKLWLDEFERKSSQKFIIKKSYCEPVR